MADLQNLISNYIFQPLRMSLLNTTPVRFSSSQENSDHQIQNIFLREIHSPKTISKTILQDPIYNFIYDSAKHVLMHFGVTLNCMSINAKSLLKFYEIQAAVEEPKTELIKNRLNTRHSQLSKFLLFFIHPFQMHSDKAKPSFPTLSRPYSDAKREPSMFMMSVCGSKFTQKGSLCFSPHIASIKNMEVGLKADEFEEAEVAEEFFSQNAPSTSDKESFIKVPKEIFNDSTKALKNVKEHVRKTSRIEQTMNVLDENFLQKDRQKKQARKRKNRRRKQNRKNREEYSSSKGSTGSSNHDSDCDSVRTIDDYDSTHNDDVNFVDIDHSENCDDGNMLIRVGVDPHFSFFGDSDFSGDEENGSQEAGEDFEDMFFNCALSLSSLNPVSKPSTNTTTFSTSPRTSSAINIPSQPQTASPSFNISPSPDYTVHLTAADIARNLRMADEDRKAKQETLEANERWSTEYTEKCSTCDRAVQDLLPEGHNNPMISCPAKRPRVQFSDHPSCFVFNISDDERRFLVDLQFEIEKFVKEQDSKRDLNECNDMED